MDEPLYEHILSFPLGTDLEVGLMSHILGVCLTFLKNCQTVSPSSFTVLCSQGSPSTYLPGVGVISPVYLSHSDGQAPLAHSGFNWSLPNG